MVWVEVSLSLLSSLCSLWESAITYICFKWYTILSFYVQLLNILQVSPFDVRPYFLYLIIYVYVGPSTVRSLSWSNIFCGEWYLIYSLLSCCKNTRLYVHRSIWCIYKASIIGDDAPYFPPRKMILIGKNKLS